jgi:hypothetical protein
LDLVEVEEEVELTEEVFVQTGVLDDPLYLRMMQLKMRLLLLWRRMS